jgi:Rieske Fe-S protein
MRAFATRAFARSEGGRAVDRSDETHDREEEVRGPAEETDAPDLTRIDRRAFFGVVAACSLGLTGVALATPAIASLVPPARSIDGKTKIGALAIVAVKDLPVNKPVPFEYGDDEVFAIRQTGDKVIVLSAACPHVACKLHWDDATKRFACPCHASFFTLTGVKISGPAVRNMDPAVFAVQNGTIVVSGIKTA